MTYVDGFVFTIKKGQLAAYKKMASDAGKVWKKYGALQYVETVGEDMNPNMGGMKCLTFPKIAKPKPGEKVGFSFIIYRNKAHRNSVNKKVMDEMHKKHDEWKDMPMPFDMKKMTYGGFEVIVEEVRK